MSPLVQRLERENLLWLLLSVVAPAALLLGVAIACGVVRTAALALFAVLLVLRAVMVGLERLGAALPSPRLGGGAA